MCNSFSLISALTMGLLVLAVGTLAVQADETTQICINDTAKKSMHFNVQFKDGGKTAKMDSEPFDKGEKCLDIPASSTDLELNVYRKKFIIWAKVCTKSWTTAPVESIHGELAESSAGIECAGI